MKCSSCSTENKDGAKFCAKCGTSLAGQAAASESIKPCPGCGQGCRVDAKFCPKCGSDFGASTTVPPSATTNVTSAAAPVSGNPCGYCGAKLKPVAKFCGKCGKTVAPAAADLPVAQTSQETAAPISAADEQEHKPNFVQAMPNAIPATPSADRSASISTFEQRTTTKTKPSLQQSAAPQKSAPKQSTPGTKHSVPAAAIATVAIVLAGALGVGGYFLFKPKASEQPVASTPTKVPADPAPAASSPQADPAPATPLMAENESLTDAHEAPEPATLALAPTAIASGTEASKVPTVPATAVPATPVKAPSAPIAAGVKEASNKSKPNSIPPRKESDSNQSAGTAAAINASLDEGLQCMSTKKYDCAIGNANTVLRLDPGNARAQDMKRKALEAQDRALSQIDIQ